MSPSRPTITDTPLSEVDPEIAAVLDQELARQRAEFERERRLQQEAEERLRLFLIQYWGGPRTYSEQRGHPRLRMRHAPYPIDITAHDRWLELMGNSLAEIDEETIPPAYREMIWDHMQRVAAMMINKAP